jgi:hypothetical protein
MSQNILLSALFSNSLSLCFSIIVREQVPHPYKTTGKIIVLYISIFMFVDSRRRISLFVRVANLVQQEAITTFIGQLENHFIHRL